MRADHCERDHRAAMLLHLMRWAERAARFLLLGAWMALISFWSAQGNLPIDQPVVADVFHGLQHRVAHLAAFGLVGLLAWWACAGVPRAAFWAVLLTSLFGATDEWHQSFTPGRHSGIDDWAWDTACAAIAVYAWTRVRTTRWHVYLRPLAPLAIGAMFVLGVGLALRPSVPLRSSVSGATLRGVTSQVAHSAIDLARSTRDVARQLRDGSRLAPALAAGERICAARFKRRHPGWAVDEERVVGARHAAQQRRAAGSERRRGRRVLAVQQVHR